MTDFELRPIGLHEINAFASLPGRRPSVGATRPSSSRTWPKSYSSTGPWPSSKVGSSSPRPVPTSIPLTLPGLVRCEVAAVTDVSVAPTHRRRGLLNAMMRRQLDDLHSANEPLAVLFASEGAIYGRYGYGPATFGARYVVDKRAARLLPPFAASSRSSSDGPGSVRLLELAQAAEAFPAVFDAYVPTRVGELDRPRGEWAELLGNPNSCPRGREAPLLRLLRAGRSHRRLCRLPGGGHRSCRPLAPGRVPGGDVLVERRELYVAVAVPARHRPDRGAAHPQPAGRRAPAVPAGGPAAPAHRELGRPHLDPPCGRPASACQASLTRRRRPSSSRWRTGSARGTKAASAFRSTGTGLATVEHVAAAPDLVLPADVLGALYLGGVPFAGMVAAGRIAECTEGAALRAATCLRCRTASVLHDELLSRGRSPTLQFSGGGRGRLRSSRASRPGPAARRCARAARGGGGRS